MVKTVINIEGMMCPRCEAHMNDAIRENFEIESVVSSKDECKTEVMSAAPLDADKIKAVVEDTGFEFKGIQAE